MQKTTLAKSMLLLSILGGNAALAEGQPEFYGQMNLGMLDAKNAAGERLWQVENQASRLGVKGEQELENALKLIYQYEVGVNPADNAKPILSQRNAFVGVKGGFGQIIMGNFDTPLKLAQGKVDLFNDTALDMTGLLAGEIRHNQSVQYSTPKLFDALTASLDWMPKEKKAQKDGLSAAVNYQSSLLSVSLALDNKVTGDGGVVTGKGDPLNSLRMVLTLNPISNLQLGLLAQSSQGIDQDKSEELGWLASAQWTLDKLALKAQFGQGLADKTKTGAKTDASISQAELGVDYLLGKNTIGYVYSGMTRFEDGAGGTVAGKSRDESSTGFGLKYKF